MSVQGPSSLLATWFGVGLSPVAPGTIGSVVGLCFITPILQITILYQWALWIGLTIIAIWSADRMGSQCGVPDHPAIVIDEVVGQWLVVLIPLTVLPFEPRILVLILGGLVLFRIYDIVKPWPVDWVEGQFAGSLGVVMDDLVAGLMAGGCLTLALLFFR